MFTVLEDTVIDKPDTVVRVIGMDPSTNNMGLCIIDVDISKTEKFKLRYVNTIFGEKVCYDIPKQFDDLSGTSVLARSYALSRAFRQLCDLYEPDTGICEDNFLGVSAGTFKQLIQAVGLVREAANDANVPLHMSYVLPNLAKDVVGANFRGTQKEDVIKGVCNYPYLDTTGFDLNKVDEHSADSIAITLYLCEQIAKGYGVFNHDKHK